MLCFRRKNFWGPSQGNRNGGSGSSSLDSTLASSSPAPGQGKNGLKSGISKLASTMAPPPNVAPAVHPIMREVTEDTPPDLLEGTMDLLVVLPSKKTVRMTVNRRTPMMDLLIQAATANKIVPAGHIVQVRNERGIELPYKPSTPIGALDTTTIEIVPKNQVNEYIIVKKQTAKLANQPFEQTFRLQVHLPRNQLYVMRVSPKTLLEDILQEVCQEKNLDCTKYEMRHPVKLDEKLPLDRRLGDFGLQELTVVSRNSRINSSVSTADIMALQQEEGRSKGCLDSAFKHSRSSVGDSSVSSESAVSARGISPSRSDDSRSISPLPPVRPKLKLNTTMSNASSSSGTSSSVPKSQLPPSSSAPLKKSGLNSSVNNIAAVQAPPRPKKRAAPLPPGMVSHQSLPPPSSSSTPLVVKNNVNAPVTTTVPSTPLSNISNNSSTVVSPPIRPTPRKKEPPREPPITKATFLPIHHSRHSSDSSGYHEACEPHDNHHRFDRQQSVPSIQTLGTLPTHARVSSSVSVTNLTTVSSISTTSLASSNGGVRKRKAPRPPVPSLQAQKETEEELSASTPSLTTIVKGSESFGTREAPVRNNRKVVSNKSEPETSVEEVAAEEEPESPVQQITVSVPERKVERKLEKVVKAEEKAEEPLQSQPSLEETSLPPTPSQGSSLSSSTCSSTNNSSQGSTSSSPVPTPEGSCSTPTAAAPSSQESFEETPPETTASCNPTTAKMSSLSSPSPVVPVVEESTSASPSMGRPTSTNAQVDVHDTHDDSALVSSESEASCTDSGIPQTETVTPSPVDRDLDRSEKDLSSETSSRRSSMHSMGGTETSTTEALREILQAKIESEQEIIDKAFEGIDADILDMEEEENEEMEEEMRKKSNNFDLIKPPNMSNLLESNTSSPHPATDHTSDDERDAFSLSSHDDEEEKELKFSVENEPIEKLDKSDPRLQNESESMVKAVVVQRKLPKSESFSHNSEFDVVKMKRRVFSKEGKVSAVVKKSYDCSSSDEEDQPENKKALPPNSKGRAGSMQNLSNLGSSANNSSGGVSSSSGSIQTRMGSNQLDSRVPGNVNNRRNSPPQSQGNKEVRKATSVLNIQDLDPDISQNPQLMASFQNELEAQFEQWKEQFLQRHLGGSKATSFDNASNRSSLSDAVDQVKPSTPINQTSVDETESVQSELTRNNSREHTVIQTTAEVHSVRTDQVINTQEKEEEEEPPQETEPVLKEVAAVVPVRESTEAEVEVREAEEAAQEPATVEEQQVSESFDPEKPQIIHSVSSTVSQQQPSVTSHLDNNNVSSSSDNKALAQVDASVTLKPTEEIDIVKTEEETTTAMPVITTDKSVKKQEEEPKVYKYSGPPTIQMGTWGERPSRSVSVKKDTDYIMGMGQQNPQLEKLSVGSVAARISSYVSSQPPPQKNTSTLTRSTTVNSNGAPRPKSIAVIHTGSIDLPSSQSPASTAPVSKVVSSWQQRLEQNKQSEQNERKSVLPNGSNSLETPVTTTVIETEAKTLVHSESSSTTSTLERPKKLPAMAMFENNSNSSTLPPSLKYGERRSFGYNANNSKSVDEIDSASDYSSSSSRPNSSLSRAPSNASTSNITIGSMSDSTSSSPVPPVSLSEKKKFFQGIKPVDSGKDAPIPAQNLKGNIATIQRVFEARQKFNAGIAQKESSPTLIINSSNNNNNNNNNISSTQMVQKVMKAGSFNVDSFRRTPSPAHKVELVQQPQQQQQHKPQFQQQKTEAPQTIKITNTNRISVSAFEKPVEVKEETIKNVGNKSIIIVGSEDKIDSSPNNIFRQKLKVTAPNPPTTVSIQTGAHPQEKVNFRMNDERSIEITNKPSNVLKRAPSTPLITTATAQNSVEIPVSAGKVSSIAASLKSSNNGFFNSLQRPAKSVSSSVNSLHGSTSTLNKSSNDKPIIIKEVEKARKVSVEKTPEAVNVSGGVNGNSQPHRNSNGAPIPPPPPINLMEGVKLRPAGLSNGMNGRPKSLNTSQSLPPASKGLNSPNGDPRSEIFDAIKNSNGKFALKKTGSTILLN